MLRYRLLSSLSGALAAWLVLACPATAAPPPEPPAPAAVDPLKIGFEALPDAQRRALQDALVWTGDFNGAVAGSYGPRTRDALLAHAKRIGLPPEAALSAAARAKLLATAAAARGAVGFATLRDSRAGLAIGLPLTLLPVRTQLPDGTRYAAPDASAVVDTTGRVASPGGLDDMLARLTRDAPGRRITYKLAKPDFIVVSGEVGDRKFYSRYASRNAGGRRSGDPWLHVIVPRGGDRHGPDCARRSGLLRSFPVGRSRSGLRTADRCHSCSAVSAAGSSRSAGRTGRSNRARSCADAVRSDEVPAGAGGWRASHVAPAGSRYWPRHPGTPRPSQCRSCEALDDGGRGRASRPVPRPGQDRASTLGGDGDPGRRRRRSSAAAGARCRRCAGRRGRGSRRCRAGERCSACPGRGCRHLGALRCRRGSTPVGFPGGCFGASFA